VVCTPERDRLKAALKERGVAATVYYGRPHHLQPVFAHLGYREGSLPETERRAREAIALPMFPTITAEQQQEVVAGVQAAAALV
jgi:dTDP-4-amino-4,6-dideoxygalactose transaminase